MKPQDFRTLYIAIGFAMVLMKENGLTKGGGAMALRLAKMIEEFCHAHKIDYIIPHADRFETQRNITDAMIAVFDKRGACETDDLEKAGFDSEDIAHCWESADTLTRIRSRWTERAS